MENRFKPSELKIDIVESKHTINERDRAKTFAERTVINDKTKAKYRTSIENYNLTHTKKYSSQEER